MPAVSYARKLGLKPADFKFVRSQRDDFEHEHDENAEIKLSFAKTAASPAICPKRILKAKDNSYMSDKNYHAFKKQSNLKLLPSIMEIKKQRKILNQKLNSITNVDAPSKTSNYRS